MEILITASAVDVNTIPRANLLRLPKCYTSSLAIVAPSMVNIIEFLPGNTMRVNAVILVHHNHSFELLLSTCCPARAFWLTYRLEKEKQRHSVHSESLFFPFIYVYIQHKFNVSHCPLTDISTKVSPKIAIDTLLAETKWLTSSLSPAMHNSPKPEAGINAFCGLAIPFITVFTQRFATPHHGKTYLAIPSP